MTEEIKTDFFINENATIFVMNKAHGKKPTTTSIHSIHRYFDISDANDRLRFVHKYIEVLMRKSA